MNVPSKWLVRCMGVLVLVVGSGTARAQDAMPAPPLPEEVAPPPDVGFVPPQPPAQGQWVNSAEYGWIWVPYGTVTRAIGEVPYAYLYTPSYGWTWYASPWGWGAFAVGGWVTRPAPFGYRAWVRGPSGWSWYFGPRHHAARGFYPRQHHHVDHHVHHYAPPERHYYARPQQHYAPPQRHYYARPQQHYAPPQRHYAAPQQHYAAPQRNYAPPQQHYAAPQRHYAPPQQHAAPRPYVAPRAYAAPRPYAAPRAYSAPRGYVSPRSYGPAQGPRGGAQHGFGHHVGGRRGPR